MSGSAGAAERSRRRGSAEQSRRAEALMGTLVTIDAADTDRVTHAFEWFRHVEATCTRFDPHSELFQLTRVIGEPVEVSTLLFEALSFALSVAEATDGAFDPTVGAEMQRRGFNHEHRTHEPAPAVNAGHVTYRDVVLDADARTVTVLRPLLLDLGAAAKGLAIDLAAQELQPLQDFAIDAGGDLYLGGRNPEGDAWTVAIRHPREAGGILARVRASNQAVCTSGNYERGDHIVRGARLQAGDVVPGFSRASQTISATVIAPSAMVADALSTAAFVLDPADAIALLQGMDVDGLIVDDHLVEYATPGFIRA